MLHCWLLLVFVLVLVSSLSVDDTCWECKCRYQLFRFFGIRQNAVIWFDTGRLCGVWCVATMLLASSLSLRKYWACSSGKCVSDMFILRQYFKRSLWLSDSSWIGHLDVCDFFVVFESTGCLRRLLICLWWMHVRIQKTDSSKINVQLPLVQSLVLRILSLSVFFSR